MKNISEPTPTEHLRELLQRFHSAMLVTRTPAGELRARPMVIAHLEDNCRAWFLTDNSSGKIHEIRDDSQVCVVCQRERGIYLSISGRALVVRDRSKIAEIWKEPMRAWFPKGKDDPNIALLAVHPEEGEYWDNEGFKKVMYLLETAKAYAKGERPHIEDGEQHAKVALVAN